MPGGSEIGRHLGRLARRSRQRAYHNSNPGRGVAHVGSSEMAQAAPHPIPQDRIADSAIDDEANERAGAGPTLGLFLVRRILARNARGMNDQRGSTYPNPTPGRTAEVLRTTHSQRSRQHVWSIVDGSPGQATATLATPGRDDGAARTGPHPQTKAVGTAATPIARLERALAHGKTPKPSECINNRVRCSHGTHRTRGGRAGGSGRYGSDLLTVRGTAKPGQTGATWGDLRDVSCGCPGDTPNSLANIADSLAHRVTGC
jgi:hypothetical protein